MPNEGFRGARLWSSFLLAASAACGGSAPSARDSLRPEVGELPRDLRSDYQAFAVNCSKCHDLERALAAPVTDNRHWDYYVAKMMRTGGSAIHAREAPHILRFLHWYTDRKIGRSVSASAAQSSAAHEVPPKAPLPVPMAPPPPETEARELPAPEPAPAASEPESFGTEGGSTP